MAGKSEISSHAHTLAISSEERTAVPRFARVVARQSGSRIGIDQIPSDGPAKHGSDRLPSLFGFSLKTGICGQIEEFPDVAASKAFRRLANLGASARLSRFSISFAVFSLPRSSRATYCSIRAETVIRRALSAALSLSSTRGHGQRGQPSSIRLPIPRLVEANLREPT